MIDSKELVWADALAIEAINRIRRYRGCEGVSHIAIMPLADERADANWTFGAITLGNSDERSVARAAIYVRHDLARRYDIIQD